MTKYFHPINVILFILLILLFTVYSFITNSLLKYINLDPLKTSAFSFGKIYIGFTYFNLAKILSIVLGHYLFKYLHTNNIFER